MQRTTLSFRLSDAGIRSDLVREFALHHDVVVTEDDTDGASIVTIETISTPAALWDVRATVGMFDDGAEEIGRQTR